MWKLISGLLALPVLLVLAVLMLFRGSEDYTRVVNLNWELDLPASQGCLYETDSGASFHGDGERYHVLEYAGDGRLEQALAEQATPLPSGTRAWKRLTERARPPTTWKTGVRVFSNCSRASSRP